MQETIEVAPLRIGETIKGLIIIYGLTIVVNCLLNWWVKAFPIGPWVGEEIQKLYWFDNVCCMVFSLWWCFLFIAVGNWPFTRIEHAISRGVVATLSCWILGWLSAKSVYWLGLGIDWAFPIIGNIYFLLAFLAFFGENWPWAQFSPPRQFGLLLLTVAVLTWIIANSFITWVPSWWFPFSCMGLASGLFSYLFRKMRQPMKAFMMWALTMGAVAVWLMIAGRTGTWDWTQKGIGDFWKLGSYGMDFLLLFMVGCSFTYGVLVPLHNWPFTKIRMPYGGILACLFTMLLSICITLIMKGLVGILFSSIYEALTLGYMGVAWSFFIPHFFGIGFQKPYLWTGQKTPGTWDDVD